MQGRARSGRSTLRNLVRIYRRTHRRAIVIDGRVALHRRRGGLEEVGRRRPHRARVARQHDPGHGPAGRRHPVGLRRELGLLHRRGARGAAVLPAASIPAPGPCSVSVVSSPSDAQQPIRAALLAQLRQRPAPALDLQLLLHPRPAPAEGGGGPRARRAWTSGSWCRATTPTRCRSSSRAGRYYEELLEAGVRIFEFQPAMMHAKTVVVDDALVASSARPTWTSAAWSSTRRTSWASPTRAVRPARSRRASRGTSRGRARFELEEWRAAAGVAARAARRWPRC